MAWNIQRGGYDFAWRLLELRPATQGSGVAEIDLWCLQEVSTEGRDTAYNARADMINNRRCVHQQIAPGDTAILFGEGLSRRMKNLAHRQWPVGSGGSPG